MSSSNRNQTRKPDHLFLVDNASTDNISDYVRELEITIPLTYIRLEHNIGGAGGFYTGMKRAYDTHLYDAVWVMDDDGEPDSKCLSNL